jgi:hypothetical protein
MSETPWQLAQLPSIDWRSSTGDSSVVGLDFSVAPLTTGSLSQTNAENQYDELGKADIKPFSFLFNYVKESLGFDLHQRF